jgi:probable F420-dependent oxidoreductase
VGAAIDRIGIWSGLLRRGDPLQARDAVVALDDLGYGAVWMPAGAGATFFPIAEDFLSAAPRIAVAAGILGVWTNPAADVAREYAALADRHPGRFLLGLGVSHAHLVERQTGQRFEHPVAVMNHYLDALAASAAPVPREAIVLAALGPRMLELSRDRSAGAHPYFVPPEHVARARETLGADAMIGVELAVVIDPDPASARTTARRHTAIYTTLPNYTNNLREFGYGDDDFANAGSDRLVDAIVAWGDLAAIRTRVLAMRDAGADHVCIQVIRADDDMPRADWRELAAALVQ